ncbi:MAG: AAA family ATPase [Planctomycetota bacterium]
MVKLRWLEVTRFRNLAPGCRLEFDDGVNLLLGRNGTGKTNLLELISMALRLDFSGLEGEAAELSYSVWEPEYDLEFVVETRVAEPDPAVAGHSAQPRTDVFCQVRVLARDGSELGLARVAPGALEILPKRGESSREARTTAGQNVAAAVLAGIRGVVGRERSPLLPMLDPVYRFDEGLHAFSAMHGLAPSDRSACSPPGARLQVWVRSPATMEFSSGYCSPRLLHEALDLLGAGPEPVITFPEEIAELLGVAEVVWKPRLLEEKTKDSVRSYLYEQFSIGCRSRAGDYWSDDRLSFGQKRLLAWWYYLSVSQVFAIADELVNGFHRDWIEVALRMIGGRQAFLTSQNPLLLDFHSAESAEQAERMFVRCSLDEQNRWAWRNFSASEAQSFVGDLESQALQVSEILRRRGLW